MEKKEKSLLCNCKACGKEVAKGVKKCPSCGKDQRNFFMKHKILTFIVAIFVLAGISGAMGGDSSPTDETSDGTGKVETSAPKKEKFEITGDIEQETDQMATYLKGIIKNNSGKDCTYVQVTFNLYDKDGNQIGTALDNINNLEKDGTWKFKAMGVDVEGEIASYKLAEITGY